MPTLKEFNDYGAALENIMILRTSPLAVKMLKSEADIPEGAVRPKKDRGYHLAQCQAFSISRRMGESITMLKEDNWCWGSLFAYGLIDPKIAENYPALTNDMKHIPLIEYGKYVGVVSAPLKTANFEPDLVLIYSNVGQLRHMLHVMSFTSEKPVNSMIYPVASCAMEVVPTLSGEYYVTIPDPGEYGRALAGEDEITYSVPSGKVGLLVSQLKSFEDRKMGYRHYAFLEYNADFPRPKFYKDLYRECGLDADDIPTWPVR
jgi:uncharacterized protein (DUF169 family)